MGLNSTALYCCLLLACSLVSAKNLEKDELMMEAKPTEAPLIRSTIKPPNSPIVVVKPTKALIFNAPPKKISTAAMDSMPEEPQSLEKTPIVVKAETLKTNLNVSDKKPVQVTGFVTKNGKIYEIEDKNGIGMIEGRQNPTNENMNVCSYGSVVIYSDVPCDQVTNIRVGEVMQTTIKDEIEQNNANNQNTQVTNQNNNNNGQNDENENDNDSGNDNSHDDDDFDDFEDDGEFNRPAPVRKPNQKRRHVQQNKNKRRRNGNKNNRKSSLVNSNQPNRRRNQAQQNRKRKNQQQNRRRRLQNQQQQQKQQNAQRRQQNNENRIRPNQRRGIRKGNGNNNNNGNGSRNTIRNGNGNRRRFNQRQQQNRNQSNRRQQGATNGDRRRFDEEDDY